MTIIHNIIYIYNLSIIYIYIYTCCCFCLSTINLFLTKLKFIKKSYYNKVPAVPYYVGTFKKI